MVSVLFLLSKFEEFSGMKLKMDENSYKSAENYCRERREKAAILAEPQVLEQWDDII